MCPGKESLMNYLLGREVDRNIRFHVHVCRKCRQEMFRLEDALLAEALERESAGFRPLRLQGTDEFCRRQ